MSLKMDRMTVAMRTRKTIGAWLAESPAPMEVTMAILASVAMPAAFMALMTLVVPSVSMVAPTSFVLPPRETTTPVVSFVMTLATSSGLETFPRTTVRLGSETGAPSFAPPVPGGWRILEGSRARTVTFAPRRSAWTTHSEPVPPVPPKTTMLLCSAGVALATTTEDPGEDRARLATREAATPRLMLGAMFSRAESADAADIVGRARRLVSRRARGCDVAHAIRRAEVAARDSFPKAFEGEIDLCYKTVL